MYRLTPRIGQLRAAHSQSALRPVGVCGHDALDLRASKTWGWKPSVVMFCSSSNPAPPGVAWVWVAPRLTVACDQRHVRAVGRVLDDEGAGVLAHVDAEPQLARGPVAQKAHPGEPAGDVPHRASAQEAAVPLAAGSRRSTEGTPPDLPARRAAEALAVGFGPRRGLDAVSVDRATSRSAETAEAPLLPVQERGFRSGTPSVRV
ncbi:hypothetical protein GCM10009594_02890 [Kocuria palustris]